MSDNDNDDDNEVGYKKPPKKHQFKPGQSGNPRGRPRTHRSLHAMTMDELKKSIVVTEGGRSRRMSKGEAVATNVVNMALRGNFRAMMTLMEMAREEERAKLSTPPPLVRFTLSLGERPLPGYGEDGLRLEHYDPHTRDEDYLNLPDEDDLQ